MFDPDTGRARDALRGGAGDPGAAPDVPGGHGSAGSSGAARSGEGAGNPGRTPAPESAELAAFSRALQVPAEGLSDRARLERIRRLEQLRAAVAAAQAVEVAAFVTSRRDAAAKQIASTERKGVGRRRRFAEAERGMVAEVALARRVSPAQASRFIGFALSAPDQLPRAFELLAPVRWVSVG